MALWLPQDHAGLNIPWQKVLCWHYPQCSAWRAAGRQRTARHRHRQHAGELTAAVLCQACGRNKLRQQTNGRERKAVTSHRVEDGAGDHQQLAAVGDGRSWLLVMPPHLANANTVNLLTSPHFRTAEMRGETASTRKPTKAVSSILTWLSDVRIAQRAGIALCTCLYKPNIHGRQVHFQLLD